MLFNTVIFLLKVFAVQSIRLQAGEGLTRNLWSDSFAVEAGGDKNLAAGYNQVGTFSLLKENAAVMDVEGGQMLLDAVQKHPEMCSNMSYVPPAPQFRDGVWPICFDSLPTSGCVIYGAGAYDDVTFELAMARKGCEVHLFDPTLPLLQDAGIANTTHVRETAERAGIRFHPWALGGKDETWQPGQMPYTWPGVGYGTETNREKWEVHTMSGLMNLLNHTKIDAFKFDIEGAEWAFLESALSNVESRRALLEGRIAQIMTEVHFMPRPGTVQSRSEEHPSTAGVLEENSRFQHLLKSLHGLGFEMYWHEPNLSIHSCCQNVAFVWKGKHH